MKRHLVELHLPQSLWAELDQISKARTRDEQRPVGVRDLIEDAIEMYLEHVKQTGSAA